MSNWTSCGTSLECRQGWPAGSEASMAGRTVAGGSLHGWRRRGDCQNAGLRMRERARWHSGSMMWQRSSSLGVSVSSNWRCWRRCLEWPQGSHDGEGSWGSHAAGSRDACGCRRGRRATSTRYQITRPRASRSAPWRGGCAGRRSSGGRAGSPRNAPRSSGVARAPRACWRSATRPRRRRSRGAWSSCWCGWRSRARMSSCQDTGTATWTRTRTRKSGAWQRGSTSSALNTGQARCHQRGWNS
mmetsp:Transcript_4753/g.14022  ORF Transcript_4753/g.14022 Transcript_4753/m.14022 type:complete len:243 (+) Transcript_4753:461-1189(+)